MLYRDGRVQRLCDLTSGHRCHGLVQWRGAVHVFGSFGCQDEDTKGECLSQRTWRPLPEMHQARFCFSPVVWSGAVYLCGGAANSTVEVYDGQCMRLLDIKLPRWAKNAVCLVRGENMLIFLLRYTVTFSMSQDRRVNVTVKERKIVPISPNPTPVIYKGLLYYLQSSTFRQHDLSELLYLAA